MRICFAAPDYLQPGVGTPSGVGSATHALAHALAEAGHQVSVIKLGTRALPAVQDGSVEVYTAVSGQVHWYVHRLPGIGKIFSLPIRELEQAWAFWRCARKLHRSAPLDVVEATESGSLFLSLEHTLPPLVIRLHGEEHTFLRHTPGARVPLSQRMSRTLQRIAMRRAAGLIAPSRSHARYIAQEIGWPADRIRVVPHALNPSWRARAAARRGTRREPIVLFVGRLERLKGIHDALLSFARVAAQVAEARLVVAGPYHPTISPEQVAAWIKELNLTERVELLGHQLPEQLADWYARSCLLLMPSYYETFGLVALEAMTCGLPVVGYRAGAVLEVTNGDEPEQGDLIVPPGDTEALAACIVRLLGDPAYWTAKSEFAQARSGSFDFNHYAEQSLAVYRSVTAKPNPL